MLVRRSPAGVAVVIGIVCVALVTGWAPARRAAAETYTVDPVHSSVLFKIKHMNVADFYGRFNDYSGEIVLDEADPTGSSVSFEVKVASIDTNNEQRDTHLRSADFFAADQHPAIKFRSTRIKDVEDDEIDLEGELTLHGVTKPLSLKLERIGAGPDMWGGQRAGFATELTLKRSDYGMTTMLEGPNGVKPLGDEVTLIISLETVRKADE
jgi:polyisoprenoid-binding protein YceI